MFDHRHAVLRQRTCLVGTDHGRRTHRLAGMKLAHQVVFPQHPSHTQGEAHSDAHGQTLGHSHHYQRDSQHQRLQDEADDDKRLHLVGHVAESEIVNQTSHHDKHGDGKTGIRNPATQLIQLAVEGSLHLRPFARQSHATPLLAIHSRLVNHIHAVALDHRTATQHTVGRIGRFGILVIVLLVGCELVLIRLTREYRFIDTQRIGHHQQAVGRQLVAALDAHHITHHHIHLRDAVHLRMSVPPGAAQHLHRLCILHLIEHIKLPVGLHLKDETHTRRKQDGKEDSYGLEQQAPVARVVNLVGRNQN